MEKRIYIKTWLEIKPYRKQSATDIYYLNTSNDVKKAIQSSPSSMIFLRFMNDLEMNLLACFLTSYFEDLISQTNVWSTFIRMHQKLYHKPLPFFNAETYFEDEINQQDIAFLIWYFLNSFNSGTFISPFNEFIIEVAERVMSVFDEAWDYAPENKHLKSFYQLKDSTTDYYKTRKLIDTILFSTYLFLPDTSMDLREQELEIMEQDEDHEHLMTVLSETRDHLLHSSHTRLLGLQGKEWAAAILGDSHPLSQDILSMSPRVKGFFLYKGQDKNHVFIEHLSSAKTFNLTKKSLDFAVHLKKEDAIVYIGMVQWKDEWWFSGIYFQKPFDPDLILEEKNSIHSRMEVNFLDFIQKEADDILKKQFQVFRELNKGAQIVFLDTSKVEDFINDFMNVYQHSLKQTKKQKEEAKARARKAGFRGAEHERTTLPDDAEPCVVFFNPKSGVEVGLHVSSVFPAPENSYFNIEESDKDMWFLLISEDISKELAMYCISEYADSLPFFQDPVNKRYLVDIDFLLRFWKRGRYFSKPAFAFTG